MKLINISFINPVLDFHHISTHSVNGKDPLYYYGAYLYPNVCRITSDGGGLVKTIGRFLNAEEFKEIRYGTSEY